LNTMLCGRVVSLLRLFRLEYREVNKSNNLDSREIARGDWGSFLEVFSRQHEGWLATLEVVGPDIAQPAAGEFPLKGVALTSVVGESEGITINLSKAPEDHVKHTIIEPTHVWLVQTQEGANAGLEIVSADGTKTLLRFRSPVLPEFVDGVVLEP
jgi:hypothetical protein